MKFVPTWYRGNFLFMFLQRWVTGCQFYFLFINSYNSICQLKWTNRFINSLNSINWCLELSHLYSCVFLINLNIWSFMLFCRSFCESYDMKQHSTKIFRDIVNGLGSYIQSQFMSTSTNHGSQSGKLLILVLLLPCFF